MSHSSDSANSGLSPDFSALANSTCCDGIGFDSVNGSCGACEENVVADFADAELASDERGLVGCVVWVLGFEGEELGGCHVSMFLGGSDIHAFTLARMSIDYGTATSAQLKAEISGAGRSIRNVAAELGVEYTTLFKQVKGTRLIRLQTVFDILRVLNLTPAVFFTRVQERAELNQDS